jgi:hypothetical protein
MRPDRGAVGSELGMTLLELVVAMGLLVVALLVSTQLITWSLRLVEREGRALRDPALDVAAAQLRRDVQAASFVLAGPEGWSQAYLELRRQNGETVRFLVAGGTLWRNVVDLTGVEREHRALLHGLSGWRWRALTSRLVEVELMTRPPAEPLRVAYSGGGPPEAGSDPTSWHLAFALRGERSW